MSEQADRDALAEVIAGEDKSCRKALAANPGGCVGEYGWCLCRNTADAILDSDWLAEYVGARVDAALSTDAPTIEHNRQIQAETWDRAVQHIIGSCAYATASAEEWRHVRLVADLYEAKAANPHLDRDGLAERMRVAADELTATGYHAATAAELRERADRIERGD